MTTRYAILDGEEEVKLTSQFHPLGNRIIEYVNGHRKGQRQAFPDSRLTPLTTITITPEGHGREINPLGEEPKIHKRIYLTYGNEEKHSAWRTAEAALRTMPVESEMTFCEEHCGDCQFEDWYCCDHKHIPPLKTRWLAHEVNGKWVIVRRAEG